MMRKCQTILTITHTQIFNMREIKFRAWNGERMKEVLTWGFNEGFISTPHNISPKEDSPVEDFEIMQYTGLKDKKGVEIYEGDILSGNFGSVEFGSMNFGLGVVEFIEFNAQYWIKDIETLDEDHDDPQWSTTEDIHQMCTSFFVLGNIYENPELIK